MMEHTTDRLFWTLTTIIVGALLLTIGIKAFPSMTNEVIAPISGFIKQADIGTKNANSTGRLAAKNASNFDLSTLNTNTDQQAKDNAIDAQKLGFELIDNNDGTATIKRYNNTSMNVTIPAYMKLNGKTVKITGLGAYSFSSTNLNSINIPDSVTHIDSWAMQNNNLTSVSIPNSVTSIADWAFQDNKLTSVTLSNKLTSIGDFAFSMNKLTSVQIPNTVTSIGNWSFQNNQISNLSIPNSVTSIGNHAFDMNELSTVNVPTSVTNIGDNAFNDSVKITHN